MPALIANMSDHASYEVASEDSIIFKELQLFSETHENVSDRHLHELSRFFVENGISSSVTDYEFTELYKNYIDYLSAKDIKTSKTIWVLNKENEEVSRTRNTDIVTILHTFYSYTWINYDQKKSFWDREVWYINNLPFDKNNLSSEHKAFRFEAIQQPILKYNLKKCIFYLSEIKSVSTVYTFFRECRSFFGWLSENHPKVQCLNDVNREIAEGYYTSLFDGSKSNNTRNEIIKNIQFLFWYSNTFKLDGFSTDTHVFDFATKDIRVFKPNVYSEEEIDRLNQHFTYMDNTVMRVTILLENTGMRVSEALSLKQDCIREDSEQNYYLIYKQYKTKQNNLVPLSYEVALAIKAEIEDAISRGFYEYVFCNNKGYRLSYATYKYRINKICYKYRILADDGNVLRVRPHMFRGTLVTSYFNMGLDIDVIRRLIGHKSFSAIYHYLDQNDGNLANQFDPILEDRSNRILNMGKPKAVSAEAMVKNDWLPMSNGYCTKSIATGICDKANNCYECAAFKPTASHLPVYLRHYKNLRNIVRVSEANGFERQTQINNRTLEALIKVINSVDPEILKQEETNEKR